MAVAQKNVPIDDFSTRSLITYCLRLLDIELSPDQLEGYIELEWKLTSEVGLVTGVLYTSFRAYFDSYPNADRLASVHISKLERGSLE